ncbi:type II CRISPR RNA-guided endonuclease Cas9 [Vaginisenegalia massiliensis]|uniref:type II CRISPR RNA-guided endonuclease Cas9 n=1 Tax=Vaginisenegalia massiliensis TaxID=2058294 RepID=UPI000F53EAF4|nr:type II CRISPR RNA-guided endonuclease Cas9 [Vaginisenegalia massiliensis]
MYSIGLDLGIASVGWSVVNEKNGFIEDLGVRIFTARNSDQNKDRRTARSTRRLLRRRHTRLEDAKRYLESQGFTNDVSLKHVCPYELRVKGLDQALSKSEIYKVVLHIIKKRGISYLDEDSVEAASEGQAYKDQVSKNAMLLKEFTPGQIQLHRLQENGRVRTGLNAKGEYQLNVFTVRAYAQELERILRCQSQFHSEITEDFINFFVKKGTGQEAGLVYRKRPYYHGPGNEKNNSPYGRWANYSFDGKPAENIFDQLIGKDIRGNLRASTMGLTAQKYNLLNDLNNLTIKREESKLTPAEKEDVLSYLMTQDVKQFGPSTLLKILNLSKEDVKGFRIDKNEKPELHTMKTYRAWRQIFAENGLELNDIPEDTVNMLGRIITLNTDIDAVEHTIDVELPDLELVIKEIVLNNFAKLRSKASQASWHSFSDELMKELIPELLNTSDEQNTILERMGIKKELRGHYAQYSHLPVEETIEQIFNPTVAKTIKQAFKVMNELIDRYGKDNISYVTVEMPRDKNEKDQVDTIKKIQKDNLNRKDASQKYFLEKSGWTEERFNFEMRKPKYAKKLLYYYEQDGICAYSGKPILPEEVFSDRTEVDHIIPLSISLDDSLNNKVLVRAEANQEKGQRSPYQAFMDGAKLGQTWDQYVAWVKSRPYKKYKKQNLLEERDIFNPEIRKRFVERNLNDTRYSSRVVMNTLQSFFYESDTKVKVVSGSFTHTLRKRWMLDKMRETHHHHAVDATLCAVSPFVKIEPYEYRIVDDKPVMIDLATGEFIDYREYKKRKYDDKKAYSLDQWPDFIADLTPLKLYSRIKFSHQVDHKWNRKVSDATLYSTRNRITYTVKKGKEVENKEVYTIKKISDIYSEDGWEEFKKHQDDLLMKDIDPKTYEILLEIAATYPDFKEVEQANNKVKRIPQSPFKKYCEDQAIPGIQKYSKKGNGPIIRSLKYYDKKLGSHLNITKTPSGQPIEETVNGRRVILNQLNPWRTDVYYSPSRDCFELVGIKYNHCQYINGQYGVPKATYEQLLVDEKVSSDSEFRFSLYRGDRIQIQYGDEMVEGLYQSRTTNNVNYFELKPITSTQWEKEILPVLGKPSNGRAIKGLKKGMKVLKIHTSYLGKKYYITREKLKGIL